MAELPITLDSLKKDDIVKEYINCYLVLHDVRPACLIQFIDYNEESEMNNKSNNILRLLKDLFPTLHHLKISQGMLISKLPLSESDVDTNTKLGIQLGYFCSDTFDQIKEYPKYINYEYSIKLNDGAETKVSLFSFMCPSKQSVEIRAGVLAIHEKIKRTLTSMKDIIKEIKFTNITKPSIDYLINKLYSPRLSDRDILDIINLLINYEFNQISKINDDGNTIIDFDNKINKGILISILNFIKTGIYDLLLGINKTDTKLIYEKINLWETLLIKLIIESEKPSVMPSAMPSAKPSAMPSAHKPKTNKKLEPRSRPSRASRASRVSKQSTQLN